ncbi:MAG TPA: SEC-C metal-binding domain-containing protein [Bacillota bacterium]|nr:SEC-C metal-binding domain-containing protein [Bacillota bacterium]
MSDRTNLHLLKPTDLKQPKTGRNDPCPCGSGKKYKKCCLNNRQTPLTPDGSSLPPALKQLAQYYNERNSWLDQSLANRSPGEAAYDDFVLANLREGWSIEESIKAANLKYPDEALQINETNQDDVKAHYEYLSNHLLIQDKFKTIKKGARKSDGVIDTVNFIHTEDSDDLVVSFSFDEGTEFGIDGFTIHRCLKYEFILKPYERGPAVGWTADDEIILVKSVKINPRQVEITTTRARYRFDLTKVSIEDYQATLRVLKKMNIDGAYKLEIEKS